jgi:hypothetical protein
MFSSNVVYGANIKQPTSSQSASVTEQQPIETKDPIKEELPKEEKIDKNEKTIEQSPTLEANLATPISYAANSNITNNGVYRIKSYHSGKYMNVHNGINANGTNVYQWTADGSTEQKFQIIYDAAYDAYKIQPLCTSAGRIIDVSCSSLAQIAPGQPTGQNVHVWSNPWWQSSRFTIDSVNGAYAIRLAYNPSSCISVNSTVNGVDGGTYYNAPGNIFMTTYNYGNWPGQLWYFEPVASGNASGYLDVVNSTTIAGWAWNSSIPNNPIEVHVYIKNTSTGQQWGYNSIYANQYRQDLVNAGIGNGYHGYAFSVDWNNYGPGNYEVRVYGIDNNGNHILSNCPKYYTHTGNDNTPSGAISVNVNGSIGGAFDYSGDVDYYRFTAPYTGVYEFYTTGSKDTIGTLYDQTGTGQLLYNDDIATGEDRPYLADLKGYNFDMFRPLTGGNTYYIKVNEYSSSTGGYTLYVRNFSNNIDYKRNYIGLGVNANFRILNVSSNALNPLVQDAIDIWHSTDSRINMSINPSSSATITTDAKAGQLGPDIFGLYVRNPYEQSIKIYYDNIDNLATDMGRTDTNNQVVTTVLVHELGHALGLGDYPPGNSPSTAPSGEGHLIKPWSIMRYPSSDNAFHEHNNWDHYWGTKKPRAADIAGIFD